MKNPGEFYFVQYFNPESEDEFFEFGISGTDDYVEITLDHEIKFLNDDVSEDFKNFVFTFFKDGRQT